MTENIFSLLRTPLHVVAFSNSSLIPITDKQFIALGFGGLVNGRVRHCFPLNGNPRQPQCRDIEGVVQAYYHSLQNGEAVRQTLNYARSKMRYHGKGAQNIRFSASLGSLLLRARDGLREEYGGGRGARRERLLRFAPHYRRRHRRYENALPSKMVVATGKAMQHGIYWIEFRWN